MLQAGPDYPRGDMGLVLDRRLVVLIVTALTVAIILIGVVVQTT